MPLSMTGYARQSHASHDNILTWEIRTVNHRYLELSFRIPEALRSIEPELRKIAKQVFHRGKIEANLKLQPNSETAPTISINKALTGALFNLHNELRTLAPINLFELLRWPGIINNEAIPDEIIKQNTLALFEQACMELRKNREVEGTAITEVIQQRIQQMQVLMDQIKQQIHNIRQAYETKLKKRFEELQVEVDPMRLEQEILFYLQKSDIDEEMDRLQVHVNEFSKQLTSNTAIGRRLDFLLQEMNREVNTLGSKAFTADISHIVVDLKVFIEQIREQIQNVE